MNKYDGSAAFPSTVNVNGDLHISGDLYMNAINLLNSRSGISIRDYFAAKALQGLIANPTEFSVVLDEETVEEYAAKLAYQYSDAMLAERNKT